MPLGACLLAFLFAVAAAPCHARPCAQNVAELRDLLDDAQFSLQWRETTMSDGKPLLVSIGEQEGGLFMRFTKTGEGLWAEGHALVCRAGGEVEARIAKGRIRLGPAAHWLLRQSMEQGARFVLARQPGGQLRIATPGWSGAFSPAHD
jgi:hypothetical protein